jgi:hypothetical protein
VGVRVLRCNHVRCDDPGRQVRPRVLRRRLALAGLGAILAGATIGTGIAKADSGELVTWAQNNGYVGTTQSIIIRGSLVCADLSMGLNGEQAAQDLWLNTGIETITGARLFVIAAVVNLCPQYDHRGQVLA